MIYEEKLEVLMETVRAYLARGRYIQYDQRCMDRSIFLTPRRTKLVPPEYATAQRTLFLDCSSYVGALFYEAFGVELCQDLTWHMVDYVTPRVYFYEFRGDETKDELFAIEQEIRACLRAGDVITYDRSVGSGHTMLYIGDNKMTHCCTHGRPDSYDYVNRCSREYESGGLFVDDLDVMFSEKRFYSGKLRRIAIARVLDEMEMPSERSKYRVNATRGLVCSVETSHPGALGARYGEKLEYRLKIKNTNNYPAFITSCINYGKGCEGTGSMGYSLTVAPEEEISVTFSAKVTLSKKGFIDAPLITVNGMQIYSPKIFAAAGLDDAVREKIADECAELIKSGKCAAEAAHLVWAARGVSVPKSEIEYLRRAFYLHDAPGGDVLSRRAQGTAGDLAIYSCFGGTGVCTPEMISYPEIRKTKILLSELRDGDIIISANDACFGGISSCMVHRGEIAREFDVGVAAAAGQGEAMCDSLLGRFCFIIVRPSLALG